METGKRLLHFDSVEGEASMTDYAAEGFACYFIYEGERFYACINTEIYGQEGGLEPTGAYRVYLLHPSIGSQHFTIFWSEAPEDGGEDRWETDQSNQLVNEEYVEMIGKVIERWKDGKR